MTLPAPGRPPQVSREQVHLAMLQRPEALLRMSDREVLGLDPDANADAAAIRAAFQEIVRRFHPDVHPNAAPSVVEQAEAILVRATEAYRVLSGGIATRGQSSLARPRTIMAQKRPRHAALTRVDARALQPPVRKARPVEDILRDAEQCLARENAEGAVHLLHGVVARAKSDDRHRLQRLLARAYAQEPRWRRYAVAQLRGLLEESPEDAEALALLGVLYQRDGMLVRAESVLKRALAADPCQPDARAAMRRVQRQRLATGTSDAPVEPKRPSLLARLLLRAS